MEGIERQMEAVAAGKSASWASFLERVAVLRREVPEAPGAEKLLALDLIHELRGWLAAQGVTVIVPPHGAMMTDGLAPGGLAAFHPLQMVVPQEVAGSGPPASMDAFRRHMDRQRADRERFAKGVRKGVASVEEKHDSPLHERYEAEDDDGRDMLGVPAPGNYAAAVLRSPVSVPEQLIGLPVRDGRGRVVGEIKGCRMEGDKCVTDVTLNAEGVALIEQTQRSGPLFSMDRWGRKDGKPEDDPQPVDDEVHHPDIVNAIRSRELYESAGVGLPERGHLAPGAVASPSPTGEALDLSRLSEAMKKVTLDDIDDAVKGILAPVDVWEPGTKCPTCDSPSRMCSTVSSAPATFPGRPSCMKTTGSLEKPHSGHKETLR
jgi:hypothetical protein